MSVKKAHTTYLLLPGRQWLNRATLALMLAMGVTLMGMSKANNPAIERMRTGITDMVTPVLAVAASPMDAIYNVGSWVRELAQLRAENVDLRNQNIQLLKWQTLAKSMQDENQSLRTLLHVVPLLKTSYVTARIVSDLGGPYVHSALINGGGDNGVHKDEAVISQNGLLGRVIDVGKSSSRVLLLNDINSRVPVIAEHAHERSILVGNNSDMPTLSYLSGDSKIEVGERLVTSGDGGVFPEGIPVGIVLSVDKGVVKVQPYADPARIEYVSVVDYSL